ncbi:MAG: diacylglycerol kinase [Armatimonadota bacterium]
MESHKKSSFSDSVNNAIDGIIYAFKTEKNLKIHFSITLFVLVICLWLDLKSYDLLFVFFAIALVLVAEMLNTAIEAMVNLLTLSHHPLAKIAKDVAAGGVFLAVINSLIVAYIVFFKIFKEPFLKNVITKIKAHPYHLIFILFAIICILVLIVKALSGTGRFTRGGLISGHAAVAFAASTAILCLTRSWWAGLLAFIIAILVAQSRVEAKIHHWFEVLLGALIGTAISLSIFILLKGIF